jgi:hypothetical protein
MSEIAKRVLAGEAKTEDGALGAYASEYARARRFFGTKGDKGN